jgi:formylglycine-generating enzyme required for sulfatase activity
MLTNKLPFTGDSPLSIVLKHVSEMPPSPRQFNPNIPESVEAVVMRCLSKDPKDRQTSTIMLAEELAGAVGMKVAHRTTGAYSPVMKTASFIAGAGEESAPASSSSPSSSDHQRIDNPRMQTQPMSGMPTSAGMPASGTIVSGAKVKGKVAKKAASAKGGVVEGETLETPSYEADQEITTTSKSKLPIILVAAILVIGIGVVVAVKFMGGNQPGPVPGKNGGDVKVDNTKYPLTEIKAGAFTMGRDAGVDALGDEIPSEQTPSHPVSIDKPFYLAKYEVTNAQYKEFTLATNHPVPPHWQDNTFAEGTDDQPVGNVSYDDAVAYCEWRTKIDKEGKHYRLPTEEEWEYAARGAQSFLYPWGQSFEPGRANTKELASLPLGVTTDTLAKDTSPFGIVGMAGNVSEWTSSERKLFPGNKDTMGGNPGDKVIRGGNFKKQRNAAVATFRTFTPPSIKNVVLGFRIAADGQK